MTGDARSYRSKTRSRSTAPHVIHPAAACLIALTAIIAPASAVTTVKGLSASNLDIYGGHNCAIMADDSVECWGNAQDGRLGFGGFASQGKTFVPFKVDLGAGRTAKQVDCGLKYCCAVLDDDTLKCWGKNNQGQLGVGDTTDRYGSTAVNLGAGRSAKMVSAGGTHTCAILDDNTLKCWGDDSKGQLGKGSVDIADLTAPHATAVVNLGAGRSAKMVSAGYYHTCAILDDDTLKCWGDNTDGALGDGSSTQGDSPVAVTLIGGDGKVKMVSAGYKYTCAIMLADNTLQCWGQNNKGEVFVTANSGTRNDPGTAVTLPTGRTAKFVSTAVDDTCVVLDDDTLYCAGGNEQLNHGSKTGSTTGGLTTLPAGRTAKTVSMGGGHCCVILDDDSVACAGSSGNGELGSRVFIGSSICAVFRSCA